MIKKLFNKYSAPMFGVFSLALLLGLPLRAYQFIRVIEPVTGFYKEANPSITLLYALLLLTLPIIFLSSYLNKSFIGFRKEEKKSIVLGLSGLYVAVALVMDSIAMANNFNILYYGARSDIQNPNSQEIASLTMRAGAIPMLMEAIFASIAALFFIFVAIGFFRGKNSWENLRLLALSPLLWAIFRILHRFMRTISFLRVSDLFLELLALVFLMLFFLSFAQLMGRVNFKGADWRLVAYGLNAAFMCLLCFVPRFAMSITGHSDRLAVLSGPEQIDLALAVFIIVFVLNKIRFTVRKEA